jgi:predicted Zn-dependent protease
MHYLLPGRRGVTVLPFSMSQQDPYDEAMSDFSRGDYDSAITKLKGVLAGDAGHFEAQLALGMAYYRKGEYKAAITEGRKAEALRPGEQLVHTNLSLFYMKVGEQNLAEHHGMQARIAFWKTDRAHAAAKESAEAAAAAAGTPPSKPPEKPAGTSGKKS